MFDICLVVTPGMHWEQQWSYLLSHFAPRQLYTIGKLDSRVRPFTDHITVKSAEELPSPLVVMTPKSARYVPGQICLTNFNHPKECCYLFGADNTHLSEDHLGKRQPDHSVFIPTETSDTMYSFIAGAITLWDRWMHDG